MNSASNESISVNTISYELSPPAYDSVVKRSAEKIDVDFRKIRRRRMFCVIGIIFFVFVIPWQ